MAEGPSILAVLRALGWSVHGEMTQQILCPNPAHVERHPSARVYVETASVYCFVCGRAWDVVGVVQLRLGTDAVGARAWLAERFGVAAVGSTWDRVWAEAEPDWSGVWAAWEARWRARRGRVPAAVYHRVWVVLDTLRATGADAAACRAAMAVWEERWGG